ncbi:MAG: hypothetical protein AAF490_22230 [Chloroflexota bacterium]
MRFYLLYLIVHFLLLLGCQYSPEATQASSAPIEKITTGSNVTHENETLFPEPFLRVPTQSLIWSPTDHSFLYDNCHLFSNNTWLPGTIFLQTINNQHPNRLISEQFFCPSFGTNFRWAPDGERFLFNGLALEDSHLDIKPENAHIWLGNRSGEVSLLLNREDVLTRWSPIFNNWLDENRVVYSGYGGGGHILGALLDVSQIKRSSLFTVHTCTFNDEHHQFIGGCSGGTQTNNVTAWSIPIADLALMDISEQIAQTDDHSGRMWIENQVYLSYEEETEQVYPDGYRFNSVFNDWLPDSQKMLVTTWGKGLDLIEDAPVETQLQLWDVQGHSLELLADGGRNGRFTTTGKYLAYISYKNNSHQLELMDMATGNIIFTKPVWYSSERVRLEIDFTFSPNGRFLTVSSFDSVSKKITITIFDTVIGAPTAELDSAIMTPNWSPNSTYFLYLNELNQLTLINVETLMMQAMMSHPPNQQPRPEWSFDGQFFSINTEEMETAVFSVAPFN